MYFKQKFYHLLSFEKFKFHAINKKIRSFLFDIHYIFSYIVRDLIEFTTTAFINKKG